MALFCTYGAVVAFLTLSNRVSIKTTLVLTLLGLNVLALFGRMQLLPVAIGSTLRLQGRRAFLESVLLFVIWSTAGILWTIAWALIIKHKIVGDTPIIAAITFGPPLAASCIAVYYFVKAFVPRS